MKTVRLGDIVDIKGGGTPDKSNPAYWGGPIPWASVKDFKSTEISTTTDFITKLGVEKSATNIIPEGSIIIPTRMAVGKAAINTIKVAINQDLKALFPKIAVDRRYLLHVLLSKADELERHATGATVKGITLGILKSLDIPLPSLPEQRRIATILDKAEALRAKRREAIEQLRGLTQAIFIEMFGNPITNPLGWPTKHLDEVGKLDRGVSKHRPRNAPELLGGPYPLVQTGDVANCDGYIRGYQSSYSEMGLRQSKLWPTGTLCITIAANIAKTGILTFEACFPDSVVGFLADEPATIEYVRVWLSFLQKMLEETAPESAQKNINLAILRNLEIPNPPIVLQRKFKNCISALEKANIVNLTSLKKLDALFASLQHRAFRGEL